MSLEHNKGEGYRGTEGARNQEVGHGPLSVMRSH